MNDELTEIDIKKMQMEIEERKNNTPNLITTMVRARELGDLSENEEYKHAKRELNANYSRIRYLTNMIKSAKIITVDETDENTVGLFDKVTIYDEEDEEDEIVSIVTTLRNDATKGLISKESPVGKALLGKHLGDRVEIVVNSSNSYFVVILNIEKGIDDINMEIRKY